MKILRKRVWVKAESDYEFPPRTRIYTWWLFGIIPVWTRKVRR